MFGALHKDTWNGMHGLRIKAYDTNDTKESIPNDHKPQSIGPETLLYLEHGYYNNMNIN